MGQLKLKAVTMPSTGKNVNKMDYYYMTCEHVKEHSYFGKTGEFPN
jgi:hypothetical protein